MAFLIPMLLYGLWEVGRIVEVSQVLNNAAREGARWSAAGQFNYDQVKTVVTNYLQNEGIPTRNVQVGVNNLGQPANAKTTSVMGNYDASQPSCNELDCLQVTVTIPFADVEWVNIALVTGPTTQLSGTAVWTSVHDLAFPSPNPPPGY
jgi:Flp pilus assembly protein TadG